MKKLLLVGGVIVVVAALLFAGVPIPGFSGSGGAFGPPEAPPSAVAWIVIKARLTHYSASPWTIDVTHYGGDIDIYTPHDASGAVDTRGGDETPGIWHIDGDLSLIDKDAKTVGFWKMTPDQWDVSGAGQSLNRVEYTSLPIFVDTHSTYTVIASAHIWFTNSQQSQFGEVRISDYELVGL